MSLALDGKQHGYRVVDKKKPCSIRGVSKSEHGGYL